MLQQGDFYSIFYVCSIIYGDLYCISCKKTCLPKKGTLCILCSKKETYILYFIFRKGDSYSVLYRDVCCVRKDTRHLKKDTRHLKKDTRHLRKDTQHLNSVLHRDVCCMSCQETCIRCRAVLEMCIWREECVLRVCVAVCCSVWQFVVACVAVDFCVAADFWDVLPVFARNRPVVTNRFLRLLRLDGDAQVSF